MLDLLVDDRLEHALAHRADRAGDVHVRLPVHLRAAAVLGSVNAVVILSIAPTPLPLIESCAYSGSRSSTFSMSIVIFRPPSPSGIFTFARQCLSSWTSKLSTPGIVFAIEAGSFRTCQTAARGASNDALAGDLHVASTDTRAREASGSLSSSQTRWYGLQLS